MTTYHPPEGASIRVTADSPYFPTWTGTVIEDSLCVVGGGCGAWSPTAGGFLMPWGSIVAWIELTESVPATVPPSGTYEVVVGGPPRYVSQSGTWQQKPA